MRGYQQALEAAGIPVDPALIRSAGRWRHDNGAAATRALLASGTSFDALFALNDTLAIGALRALGEAGVRVPDDVAIIGFDNTDATRFSLPSLSSVDPGRDDIAEIAVEMLVERIAEKGERVPPRRIKPDFHIVGRESTGFPHVTELTRAGNAISRSRALTVGFGGTGNRSLRDPLPELAREALPRVPQPSRGFGHRPLRRAGEIRERDGGREARRCRHPP